jgi:deazaflavin-dependent oxidoreductase (nitroreductase family)
MAITEQFFRGMLKTHQALYERTDGRIGENLFGTKALLLRTKGRKSGQVRTAALTFAKDGERYLIVASKGGAPEPPAWFLNLREDPHPEIQVGRERSPATATIIESGDPDYERVWKIVNDANSQRYDAYQRKTSRPIPVVALTRTG